MSNSNGPPKRPFMPNGPFDSRPTKGLLPLSAPINTQQAASTTRTGWTTTRGRYGHRPQQPMGPPPLPPQPVTFYGPNVTFTAAGPRTIAVYGSHGASLPPPAYPIYPPPSAQLPQYATHAHSAAQSPQQSGYGPPPTQIPQYGPATHHPSNAYTTQEWDAYPPPAQVPQQPMEAMGSHAPPQQQGWYGPLPPPGRLPSARGFRPGDAYGSRQRDSAYVEGAAFPRDPKDAASSHSSATAVPAQNAHPFNAERPPQPAPAAAPHTPARLSATAAPFIPPQHPTALNTAVANPETTLPPPPQRADPWQLAVQHTSASALPRPLHDADFHGLHKHWEGAPAAHVGVPGFPHLLSSEASAGGKPEVITGPGAGTVAQGWTGKARVIMEGETVAQPAWWQLGMDEAVQGHLMQSDGGGVAVRVAEKVLRTERPRAAWEQRDTNQALREWEKAAGLRRETKREEEGG